MNKITLLVIIIFSSISVFGCASSIVDGEFLRTSNNNFLPKDKNEVVEIYLNGKSPQRGIIDIGRVMSRAWVLEKGMSELKIQARKLGADAIVNIRYERRFSADYLQDLYFLNGDAVAWK